MRRIPARASRVELRRPSLHLRGVERLELRCMLNGGPIQLMPAPDYSGGDSHSDYYAGGFDHDGGYVSPSMQHDRGGRESLSYDQPPMHDAGLAGDNWMSPQQQDVPSLQNGSIQAFEPMPQPSQQQPQQSHSEVIVIFVPINNPSASFIPPAPNSAPGGLLPHVAERAPDLSRAVSHLAAPLPFDLGDLTAGATAAAVVASASQNQTAAPAANRSAAATMAPATTIATSAAHLQSDHEPIATSLSPLAPKNSGSAPVATQSAVAKNDVHASAGPAVKQVPPQAPPDAASALAAATESKASLAEISLNLKSAERALESVMSEIERFGEDFGQWVDENKLTCVAVGMTAATLGAATAYYLRRRAWQEATARDDETSSNLLFVRMHTTVGDR
jgi:hypothetical protein